MTHSAVPTVQLTAASLTIQDVVRVARRNAKVEITTAARDAMLCSRALVESRLDDGLAHYGINTGFGSLARKRIDRADLRQLQTNLIRSHAAGIGEFLPRDVTRGMMLLLAASLSRGLSGVRPLVVEQLVAMLNTDIIPAVPSVGSVGASGDLAPLAAVGLALLGEGDCLDSSGGSVPIAPVLQAAGIKPIGLDAKEGLAIINGTHLMCARGCLNVSDAETLLDWAVKAAAMSIDACRGSDCFLDSRIHTARNQPGQQWVALQLRDLLKGSEIIPSHKENDPRVQDPYSLRCTPQVLGAARDCLSYVKQAIEHELGAVTDNPLVFADPTNPKLGNIVSGGNFHGMPLAIPLDTLTIAIAHIAGISERRTFWLLSALDPESHLGPYLAPNPGLNSGLMIAQYTAAACCNEIITLATPASVSNVSTSAGIEDYNSFGPRAAAKAARAIDLAKHVVAIELLCAAEGLEYQRPLKSGAGVEKTHAQIRGVVTRLTDDRSPTTDINRIVGLMNGTSNS